MSSLATIDEALDDLAARMVILVDDEDRENEGDLIGAAELATPEMINFMAMHGRGLICMATTADRLEKLGLPPMTNENTSPFQTAFHLSFESATGVTTGISAQDRARSIVVASNPASTAKDLVRPGHMFPLCAREGGVLVRAGQTEGSVDLMKLAGMQPAAVLCEIMNGDGTMARLPQLQAFALEFNLRICSVADIIAHRRRSETLVQRAAETSLPTEEGTFRLIAYETMIEAHPHVALVWGTVGGKRDVLVRVHSECLTGDVFHSLRCDCGSQLHAAMEMISGADCGVLVYMRQEGRGIGLVNKIRAYTLQDEGMDTVEANVHLGFDPDPREYGIAAQILNDLGVRSMRLITNNPIKRKGLEAHGLEITARVPLEIPANDVNRRYMETKKQKLGHFLS